MTEKNQDRIKINTKIKGIFFGIVALLVVTMSLFHVFFKENTNELITHKKTYKSVIKEMDGGLLGIVDNHIENLREKYPNDSEIKKITSELKSRYTDHYTSSINGIKKYKKKTQLLSEKQSFMGRANFRFWIWIFGITVNKNISF